MTATERLKEPLSAAIRDILEPVILPIGFGKFAKRTYLRFRTGDIVQTIDFGKPRSSWYTAYNTIPLFQPLLPESNGLYYAPPGARLKRVIFAKNHEAADREMTDIVAELRQGPLHWLESTSSTEGLLLAFDDPRNGGIPHLRAYYKALCLAQLERIEEALALLPPHFECFNESMRKNIRELHSTLESGAHRPKLDEWSRAYRKRLGLTD